MRGHEALPAVYFAGAALPLDPAAHILRGGTRRFVATTIPRIFSSTFPEVQLPAQSTRRHGSLHSSFRTLHKIVTRLFSLQGSHTGIAEQ